MTADSYLVFSLKYRPQTFDEILFQDPVKETLKKAILNCRVAHSYLFCGPRGVGKTTTARVLAKALNCEKGPTVTPCGTCPACREVAASRSLDVIEIDGASNRQIDDIRELRENIKYAPSAGRYKVYIIDEVHMLTEFAFNALLKTLEEPPRHAKFIFATTAPHKVPSTILSRCQRFDFRKAPIEDLVTLLRTICRREKIKVDDEALYAIARRADGSVRDSETILDQMVAFRPEGIGLEGVEQLLGLVPTEVTFRMVELLRANDPAQLVAFVDEVFDEGYNVVEFLTSMAAHLRSLLALKLGIPRETLGLAPAELKRVEEQSAKFTAMELSRATETLIDHEESVKFTLMPRILLEVLALKLAEPFTGSAVNIGNGTSRPPSPGFDAEQAGGARPATARTAGKATRTESATKTPRPRESGGRNREAEASQPGGHALWEQLLTELHTAKPLLANILSGVSLLGSSENEIRITQPAAQMWDDNETRAELAALEPVLARIAGRPIRLVVEKKAAPGPDTSVQHPKSDTLNRLRAVYDCEEL